MSRFRFREISLDNYRCFDELRLSLEEDTTVIFGENGGGKTAVLAALAMGFAEFQTGTPKDLKFDMNRDPKMRTLDEQGRREPVGPCEIEWAADVGDSKSVTWSVTACPKSGRKVSRPQPIFDALERIRVPGNRWPLFAWYGVDRLARLRGPRRKVERTVDRWEAYASALNPNLDEAPLLQWLEDEMVEDLNRKRRDEHECLFHKAVLETAVRAAPGVKHAWHDPETRAPMVRFENGHAVVWSELSNGYHAFIALVADIARRAVMLNQFDGADAPKLVEGIVLIDKLDLHLHPRCQRVVLRSLRDAFPSLQFIITTHSPQLLSSVENRHARWLLERRLVEAPVHVQGRDTNAILREHMSTDDRDEKGEHELRRLYDAIDRGDREAAERIHQDLEERWGDIDPTLIRASWFMEDEKWMRKQSKPRPRRN